DAEVGLDEGWGVVDAVAHHGHDPTLLLETSHLRDLVGGKDFGEHLTDADVLGDGGGRGPVVAGDHDDVDAHAREVGNASGGVVLEGVGHGQHAPDLASPGGQDGG